MTNTSKELERRDASEAGRIKREWYILACQGHAVHRTEYILNEALKLTKQRVIEPMKQERYIIGGGNEKQILKITAESTYTISYYFN